jgi:integration host factor subunit alpha
MNQNISSAREIIERLVKQSGITKKLAAEILHVIPDIIEEGLKKDGEVRVKGLGTFRLRWTRGRMGRNPKTGERVEIPSHNRVVFLPGQAFKEYINRDNRLLSYKIIPTDGGATAIYKTIPEQENIEQNQYHYPPQPVTEPEPIPEPEPENTTASEIGTESETPTRKRRIHWIIPVAISLIIILSLVFYLRNCYQGGGQKTEVDSRQLTVDSRQLTVDSSHQSAVSGQQSAVGSQQSAVGGQQSAVSGQRPVPTAQPEGTASELVVAEGTRLFKLAREIYGNPYLWVLIYTENQDRISDPDMLISGRELVIPALEGTPERLTRNDSMAVSEGYRLAYEYYKAKDDPRANDFFKAMNRYKPK